MKNNKVYNLALLRLIGAYALFTGIIASVFLFFFVMPQLKSASKTPQPTPTVSTNATATSTPSSQPQDTFCGGIAGKQCPAGYVCKLDGNYPDAGGTCVKKTEKEQVFCTMDAKQCPDGSYVGRQGPKCEFAPCPSLKD